MPGKYCHMKMSDVHVMTASTCMSLHDSMPGKYSHMKMSDVHEMIASKGDSKLHAKILLI